MSLTPVFDFISIIAEILPCKYIDVSHYLYIILHFQVMIRRKKSDVLSAMPPKIRERVYIRVMDSSLRNKFVEMRKLLRNTTGHMGKLAVAHFEGKENIETAVNNNKISEHLSVTELKTRILQKYSDAFKISGNHKRSIQVNEEVKRKYDLGMKKIKIDLENKLEQRMHDSDDTCEHFNDQLLQNREEMEKNLIHQLREYKKERIADLKENNEENTCSSDDPNASKSTKDDKYKNIEKVKKTRQTVVFDMFYLSGLAKVPVILAKLKRWINDPAKGKLCIFAHHKDILDLIEKGSEMIDYNNQTLMSKIDGNAQYIRIDGSTNPKIRHKSIQAFQSNHNVRYFCA